MARFDMRLLEAERLTPKEYDSYSRAFAIRMADQRHLLAWLAFQREVVQAEEKVGKGYQRVYQTFDEFHDHDEAIDRIFNSDMYALKQDKRSREAEAKRQEAMKRNEALSKLRKRK